MAARNQLSYFRSIRLAPALGDWTVVQYEDPNELGAQVLSVRNPGFNALSRDQLSIAHNLHYRLFERAMDQFSNTLDIKIELHTILAQQFSYQDFLISFPGEFVQLQFEFPQAGSLQLLLDPSLADSVVNRLTGGRGDSSPNPRLSEIELGIFQTQTDIFTTLLSQTWRVLSSTPPRCLALRFSKVSPDKKLSYRESVTAFTCYAHFGGPDLKRMTWVYPSDFLRRLLHADSLLPHLIRPRLSLFPKTLRNTKVPVTATLGRASLTMRELRELQVGDIIPLDTQLTSPIELVLGDTSHFSAQIGVSPQNRLCAQLIFVDREATIDHRPHLESTSLHAAPPVIIATAPLAAEPPTEPEHINEPVTPYEEKQPTFPVPDTSFDDDEWGAVSTPSDALEEEEFEDDDDDDDDYEAEDTESDLQDIAQSDDNDDDEDWELEASEDEEAIESSSGASNPSLSASGVPTGSAGFDDDLSWDNLDDHF